MKIDHIGINISNRNESIIFYRDVMGISFEGTIEMPTNYLHYFKTPDGMLLELFDYKQSGITICVSNRIPGLLRHIAFIYERTDEIEEILNRARAKGVEIRSELKSVEKLGICSAIIADPDGCEIELIRRI